MAEQVSAPMAAHPVVSPTTQMTPQQFAATQIAKSQSTLNQYINYLETNMGRVNYAAAGKTATSEIAGEVSPLLKQIQAGQVTGQQAINGYTSQLASNLAGIQPNVAAAYTKAEQQQAAVDAALQQGLTGAGTSQANALSAQLGRLGQDTSVAQQAAQQAQGYAGANYATGSASLSSLLAQGAAASAYGAQLPGIAALAGYQATGALQNSVASQESKVIADAQRQYPSLVNQLVNQQLSSQRNTASGLKGAAQVSSSNAKNATGYYLTTVADALKGPKTFGSSTSGYYEIDPATGQPVQITKPVQKPVSGKVVGSDKSGRVLINPRTGKVIATVTKPVAGTVTSKTAVASLAKQHGITVNEYNRYHGKAFTLAQVAFQGGTDSKGNPLPKLTRDQAIQEAEREGIPAWIYLPVISSFYEPGKSNSPRLGPPAPNSLPQSQAPQP